jgi:hypothetical protein
VDHCTNCDPLPLYYKCREADNDRTKDKRQATQTITSSEQLAGKENENHGPEGNEKRFCFKVD